MLFPCISYLLTVTVSLYKGIFELESTHWTKDRMFWQSISCCLFTQVVRFAGCPLEWPVGHPQCSVKGSLSLLFLKTRETQCSYWWETTEKSSQTLCYQNQPEGGFPVAVNPSRSSSLTTFLTSAGKNECQGTRGSQRPLSTWPRDVTGRI